MAYLIYCCICAHEKAIKEVGQVVFAICVQTISIVLYLHLLGIQIQGLRPLVKFVGL